MTLNASTSKMKAILASDLILSYPEFEKQFFVATDASSFGIGAVLYQKDGDKIKYISFASRALQKSERNYGATKRELLAIIFALKQFRFYLYGRQFELFTDHNALIFIFTQKDPGPMIQSWSEILLEFDFKITHRPGMFNILPDRLSRLYDEEKHIKKEIKIWKTILTRDVNEKSLSAKLFEKLRLKFGPLDIDAFASASNAKLPVYYTKENSAFDHKWSRSFFYMFPPTDLIKRTVIKVLKEKAKVLLITPFPPEEDWFKVLQAYSFEDPIKLPVEPSTFEIGKSI